MKSILLLPAALLLAGCATSAVREPHTVVSESPLSSGPMAAAPVSQPSVDPLSALQKRQVAPVGPVITAGTDRLEFRLDAARTKSFTPTLFLSPEGSRLAYTYEGGRTQDEQLASIAVLPLSPVPGRARLVTWAPEPIRDVRSAPGLRLIGWLDEHRLVALRALPTGDEPWASSAMRVEVLDTVDDQVTVGPWLSMGRSRWNLPQLQVWLTADRQELMINTGDLWRIELPSGQPARIRSGLPALTEDAGPLVQVGPDGTLALYGGGPDRVVRGLIDLRSGREYRLKPESQKAAFGPDRRVAVLADLPERPGAEITLGSEVRRVFGAVQVMRPDGSPEQSLAGPLGWLLDEVAFAPDGDRLVLSAVQVTPDPTNPRTKNRLSRRALFSAPLDGRPPTLLWEGEARSTNLPPWTLAGRWLLIGDRQIALSDGESLPLPEGVTGLPLTGPSDALIGRRPDGTLVRFAAGSRESVVIGKPGMTESKSGTTAGGAAVGAQMAGPWLLLQSAEKDGSTRIELLRLK